jgi:hypothetical protein
VQDTCGRLAVEALGREFLCRDTSGPSPVEQIQEFRTRTSLAAAQQQPPQRATLRPERLAHRVDAGQQLVIGPTPFATRPISRARLQAASPDPSWTCLARGRGDLADRI